MKVLRLRDTGCYSVVATKMATVELVYLLFYAPNRGNQFSLLSGMLESFVIIRSTLQAIVIAVSILDVVAASS